MTSRKITFVKKILANGQPCGKCRDVEERLTAGDHWSAIDRVVIADERDAESEGIQLAAKLGIERAPFFVVESGAETTTYTVFLKFAKEVLATSTQAGEAQLLLETNPDLDYL
jgi:Zn finger protein HypA/HybF involved in hydrogenase expression